MCKECKENLCYPWEHVCNKCYEVKDRGYLQILKNWILKLLGGFIK